MGRLYHQSGNEEQADIWMKKAIETAPDTLAARLGVAQWQWERGELDEAQKNVDAALKLQPDSLEALVIAGLVNRFQGKLPDAEGHFQTAYLASPGNAMAANQLALVLADQTDEAKRRRALELAESNVKQFNNNTEVAATLGWIYLQNNRLEDATRVLKAVIGSGRVSPDTAYFMAVLSERSGNAEDAVKALRPAVEAKGPFAYRKEAESLLAKLEGQGAKAGAATATDAKASARPTAQQRQRLREAPLRPKRPERRDPGRVQRPLRPAPMVPRHRRPRPARKLQPRPLPTLRGRARTDRGPLGRRKS